MEKIPLTQELRARPHTVRSGRRRIPLLRLPGIAQNTPRYGHPPEEHPVHHTPRGDPWVHPASRPERWGGPVSRARGSASGTDSPPHRTQPVLLGKDSKHEGKTIDGGGHRPPPPNGAGSFGSRGGPRHGGWSGAGYPGWGRTGPRDGPTILVGTFGRTSLRLGTRSSGSMEKLSTGSSASP